MFDLQRIGAFVEAAKCLNFTVAANRLYMTPSSLSKYIAQLENSLDVQLFTRSNRVVALTPAGEYLYKYFSKLLADYEQHVDYARAISTGKVGRLGLHAFPNIVPELGNLLYEFSQQYPQIELSYSWLYIHQVAELLLSDAPSEPYDAVLTKDYKLRSIPCPSRILTRSRLAVAMRRDHPLLQNGSQPALKDMADCHFIAVSDEFSNQMNAEFCQACIDCGFTPKIQYYSTALYKLLLRAMTSDCVAVCSETDAVSYSSLHQIPLDAPAEADVVLAWNPNIINTGLQAFLDFLDQRESAEEKK